MNTARTIYELSQVAHENWALYNRKGNAEFLHSGMRASQKIHEILNYQGYTDILKGWHDDKWKSLMDSLGLQVIKKGTPNAWVVFSDGTPPGEVTHYGYIFDT